MEISDFVFIHGPIKHIQIEACMVFAGGDSFHKTQSHLEAQHHAVLFRFSTAVFRQLQICPMNDAKTSSE